VVSDIKVVVATYFHASLYMIDPFRAAVAPTTTVVIGLSTLIVGGLVHDLLARLLIRGSV